MKLKLFLIETENQNKEIEKRFLVALDRTGVYDFLLEQRVQGIIHEMENEVVVQVAIPTLLERRKSERA
jgi:hypothetical protein